MTIRYETTTPFVKLFSSPSSDTAEQTTGGVAGARFVGDGEEKHGRLKVTRENEATPEWWIDKDHLRILHDEEVRFELPKFVDQAFFEDASIAARALSGFLDAGGMNVEYLLLLAWAESHWTNADAEGRDGQDVNLELDFGPFRFSKTTWNTMIADSSYGEILRGYTAGDRLKPAAQCFVAACFANHLQRALKDKEVPAWLLRVGHRIGQAAVVRLSQLNDSDTVSTMVDGVSAVSAEIVNQNKQLFPNGSATTKTEVFSAVKAEFEKGKHAVKERLGALVQESVLDGLKNGSTPGRRTGVLGFLDFVAAAESRGNYNAVVDRPNNQDNPRLVTKTIKEVLDFQQRLGARNACGKYQIIRSTLIGTFGKVALTENDLFDPDTQDKLALELLMNTRQGKDFLNSAGGQSDVEAFALRVAQEWAAMPVLTPTTGHRGVSLARGDSFYKGTAGNQALVTADAFEAAIRKFQAEA
jgi:hypothetical protein